jgi:hypothetical protein
MVTGLHRVHRRPIWSDLVATRKEPHGRRFYTAVGLVIFRFWQILLQKYLWGVEGKFLEPLMRFTRGDVRDHIVSSKIDHGPAE